MIDNKAAVFLASAKPLTERYSELWKLLAAPEVSADEKLYLRLTRESERLAPTVNAAKRITVLLAEKKTCSEHLSETENPEMKAYLSDELNKLDDEISALLDNVRKSRVDEEGDDAQIEIKAKSGGEAACGLVYKLFTAYKTYAERQGLSVKCDAEPSNKKSKSAECVVYGGYAFLKYESGWHRLVSAEARFGQDVVVSVTVLRQENNAPTEIDERDLRVDLFHSSGAGGQNINKVETAVRITHLPTGTVVVCQDERSQLKNKERAMKTLTAKLNEQERLAADKSICEKKKALLKNKTAVREYNQVSGIALDTESGITEKLDKVFGGELDAFIDAHILK